MININTKGQRMAATKMSRNAITYLVVGNVILDSEWNDSARLLL